MINYAQWAESSRKPLAIWDDLSLPQVCLVAQNRILSSHSYVEQKWKWAVVLWYCDVTQQTLPSFVYSSSSNITPPYWVTTIQISLVPEELKSESVGIVSLYLG
jgi:hypothetical protein